MHARVVKLSSCAFGFVGAVVKRALLSTTEMLENVPASTLLQNVSESINRHKGHFVRGTFAHKT